METMEMLGGGLPEFVFLNFGTVAVFSFLSVAVWVDNRRKEREAFYKSEAIKKIAEAQGAGGVSAIEYLREQQRLTSLRQREGIRLGGLICAAVGFSFTIFLRAQEHGEAYLVGLVPLAVGLALLLYGYVLAPKQI